jgi:hypothetical protein
VLHDCTRAKVKYLTFSNSTTVDHYIPKRYFWGHNKDPFRKWKLGLFATLSQMC